jgi:hypothetical protein
MSTTVKQRANVYTTMLAISFICLVIANVFLYYEMERYPGMKVEGDLRASNAKQLAEAKKNAPPEPDPMEMMPMEPDPNAPAPDPNAPAPDPNGPAPDPNAPAPDPNAPAPDPNAPAPDPAAPPAAAMPAEPNM